MKKNKALNQVLENMHEEGVAVDEQGLAVALENSTIKTAFITAISIIGGAIGVTTFLFFLGLLLEGRFRDISLPVTFLGILFLIVAYFINKSRDQAMHKGFAVSLFIVGNSMTVGGIVYLAGGEIFTTLFSIVLFMSSCLSLWVYKNELISLLSAWGILISIHSLIVIQEAQVFFNFYLAILVLVTVTLLAKEFYIRTHSAVGNRLYLPIYRAVFSYTMIISIMASTEFFSEYYYSALQIGRYFLFITLSVTTFFTLKQVLAAIGIKSMLTLGIICIIVGFFFFFVGHQYPAFSVGFLLALWTFKNQDFTGLAIALVTSLWAIALYYYDLSFNLLNKSIGLFFSGLLFLGLYALFVKKIK